jgi:hypothetical protein
LAGLHQKLTYLAISAVPSGPATYSTFWKRTAEINAQLARGKSANLLKGVFQQHHWFVQLVSATCPVTLCTASTNGEIHKMPLFGKSIGFATPFFRDADK